MKLIIAWKATIAAYASDTNMILYLCPGLMWSCICIRRCCQLWAISDADVILYLYQILTVWLYPTLIQLHNFVQLSRKVACRSSEGVHSE